MSTFQMTDDDTKPAPYGYGRKYAKGRQDGWTLFAKPDAWDNGDKFIEVTFGVGCGDGTGLGCKIDRRFNVPSDAWNDLLAVLEPAALAPRPKGTTYNIDFSKWKGRPVFVTVVEEKDRNRSKDAGCDVFRPKITHVEARALQAQNGGPL